MSNGTNPANGKTSKLVLILYIAAGVLGALFIYMFIYAINSINSYVSSYGMSFGDMWMDAIQYIINGSINYLVFGSSGVCCRKDPGYGTEEIGRKPCVCRGSGC